MSSPTRPDDPRNPTKPPDANAGSGANVPAPEEAEPTGDAEIIDSAEAENLPTSFGVFKPVGYVMIGVPSQEQLNQLVEALGNAGWPSSAARQFSPKESVEQLRAMVDNAGVLSGFGYEITLLRRYLKLTEADYRWLLVKAEDSEMAAAAAEIARGCGATMAVYYRRLTVEELIE